MKKTTFGTQKSSSFAHQNGNNRPTRERRNFQNNKPRKNFFAKIFGGIHLSFRRILGAFLMIIVVFGIAIWGLFLRDLPEVRRVENPEFFRESTTFYDGDNKEMYSFSENGKRIYIGYDLISQSIKDAIVATEDAGFFENPGIDIFGLFRAGANYALGRSSQVKGTSTLSQQLIKNTLLTNERSLKRKIQEAYLAYQLNRVYSKEKILEMYLNAIEFGHGSNGIEQASLTFFGKNAKDVGPLGASILASLPKGPSQYSPYSNRGNLMGKIEAYPTDSPKNKILLSLDVANSTYAPLYQKFKDYIKNISYKTKGNNGVEICGLKKEFSGNTKFLPNSSGCLVASYADVMAVLGGIRVTGDLHINNELENYTIEYTIGRKDYVALQTLKAEKISPETFGKIIYDGLEFQFNKPQQTMKYPYFVMYVKEELEAKYGKDLNIREGLKVYTTLNPRLQEEAEKIIREQVATNKKSLGATSASLVSMDNVTGEIVAMVGGPDYFDEKNGGNNNMTTAKRQPGSSFKPIVYGLAISRHPIGPESPVADVETKFGTYEPNNYDKKFKGIMTVGEALAYSRNIPAVKMYFLANQEKEIVNFAKKLGIETLKTDNAYGAPLALGSAEVRAIDMMQAYSVFANNGIKKEAFAIRRIEDSQGGIIEEHKDVKGQEIFSPAAAYIINNILSENNNRPESTFWRNALQVKGKTVAAKTGTANKPAKKKGGPIFPGDTWTIGYSPNYTTVVWAGNVDGTALSGKCDGLNCAAPAWNKFMTFALKDIPNTPFPTPSGLFTYKTSKLTGLLSDNGVTNIMAVELKEKDNGSKEVKIDTLCGGPVTSETPEDAIGIRYIPTSKPIIDGFDPDWLRGFQSRTNIAIRSDFEKTSQTCHRPKDRGNVQISSHTSPNKPNTLVISWSGDRMISKIRILTDGKIIKNTQLDDPANNGSIEINTNQTNSSTVVELIDAYGYKYSQKISGGELSPTLPSMEEERQNIEPEITISNPPRSSISIYSGDMFNLRFQVNAGTTKRNISVQIDGKVVETASSGDVFVIPILTADLAIGDHIVSIHLTDGNGKSTSKNFTLSIIER